MSYPEEMLLRELQQKTARIKDMADREAQQAMAGVSDADLWPAKRSLLINAIKFWIGWRNSMCGESREGYFVSVNKGVWPQGELCPKVGDGLKRAAYHGGVERRRQSQRERICHHGQIYCCTIRTAIGIFTGPFDRGDPEWREGAFTHGDPS